MKVLGVIPARYDSSRFPGKPLVDIAGQSMIMRVYHQALKCEDFEDVIVATDDDRIYAHCEDQKAKVVMTSKDHPSGTDRCMEAMNKAGGNFDFLVNIQGDEPFVHPEQLSELINALNKDVQLASLAKKIDEPEKLGDPNAVKVIIDKNSEAIYFSRNPIPYNRDEKELNNWLKKHDYFKHIGVYAYRTDILKEVTRLERSPLEIAESLEQLRWLENGYRIKMAITDKESPNVDSPEDLKKILSQL